VSAHFFKFTALLCWVAFQPSSSFGSPSTSAKAVIVDHKSAYAPKPNRGPHLDVKITPPEIRGKEGRVLIEVYNRGKAHIARVTFDVVLFNQGGFTLTAPIVAEDLKPDLSGGQWVKIPQIKGQFPKITGGKITGIRIFDTTAKELPMKAYLDLIKY